MLGCEHGVVREANNVKRDKAKEVADHGHRVNQASSGRPLEGLSSKRSTGSP